MKPKTRVIEMKARAFVGFSDLIDLPNYCIPIEITAVKNAMFNVILHFFMYLVT